MCILIPDIYSPLRIHAEDWCVCRVDQLGVLPLLSQAVSDVLANTDHANHIPLLITSRCGIKKYLNSSFALGDEWELKVICLISCKSFIENSLNRSLEIVSDEILNQ